MSPKIFKAGYARAETKSHQNWLLSDSPRSGCGGGMGGVCVADAAEGTLFGLFRESGYYSEIGTMAPWEQPPLSFKLSYIIAL